MKKKKEEKDTWLVQIHVVTYMSYTWGKEKDEKRNSNPRIHNFLHKR